MITKNFTIPLADEPYVDTTALNNTYAATYKGPKYIKVAIDSTSKVVERVVSSADTMAELDQMFTPTEANHTYHVMDASTHTFEAAYLTGMYDTGPVENYTETLPTRNAAGEFETFTYGWDDNTGMIQQQYFILDMKYENGNFIRPRFRVHALTRASFLASMQVQIASITTALESNQELTDEARGQLETYKTWLENLPVKYANVKHWKIPFVLPVPTY